MSIRILCLRIAALLMMVGGCVAAPTPQGPALTGNRVLFALTVAHVPVRSAEVEFLAPIVLAHPRATLKLASLERREPDSAVAKISCAAAGECLPFFVIVHWSDLAERDAALGRAHKATPAGTTAAATLAEPILVRAGQPATLFLDNPKMHIATPIICLQNGKQGQQIRVSSLDHKRIILAEVVDLGVLRGSL
jgi:Chaperone for flagella basal body P-ring formation